jgi:hypothetical protein
MDTYCTRAGRLSAGPGVKAASNSPRAYRLGGPMGKPPAGRTGYRRRHLLSGAAPAAGACVARFRMTTVPEAAPVAAAG